MKEFVRKHKLNHPTIKLGLKKAEMLAALDKLGHINREPRAKKEAPKKPKFKIDQSKQPKQTPSKIVISKKPALNTKKIEPKKAESYMDRVKYVRENNEFGDKIAFVEVNGEKYDWDGLTLRDGLGKKVGELRDPKLLEKWFEGILSKYNIPEVGKNKGLKMEAKPKKAEPKKEEPKINTKLKNELIKKIKGIKNLDRFLTQKTDELRKIDSRYYGSQNWVVTEGIRKTKSKMIDLLSGYREYTDEDMNDYIKIINDYKA